MSQISRRNLFRTILGRKVETDDSPVDPTWVPPRVIEDADSIAVILNHFCLAYQSSFCSVCSERCPEEGAIVLAQGKPSVNPDACTGCKICQDVCPAPKNAVFIVSRKPRRGMVRYPSEPAS
jgi:ferredoxin